MPVAKLGVVVSDADADADAEGPLLLPRDDACADSPTADVVDVLLLVDVPDTPSSVDIVAALYMY